MISVISPFDYEEKKSYSIEVSTDDGRASSDPNAKSIVNVKVLVCIYMASHPKSVGCYALLFVRLANYHFDFLGCQ